MVATLVSLRVIVAAAVLANSAAVQSGLTCLECRDVVQPRHCRNAVTCPPEHYCGSEKIVTSGGTVAYNVGCRHKKKPDVSSVEEKAKPTIKVLDSFQQSMVRNKIHEMYKKNEVVTLRRLMTLLTPEMEVSLTTLWRTVRTLGFRFLKKSGGKRIVVERADVVSQRYQYLRELRRARDRGDHIVYLDETWVNVNHAYTGEWSENEESAVSMIVGGGCGDCGRSLPTGKGKRIIVLDAGCRDVGLLPAVADVFVAKSDNGDYHSEMNHEHFINWWRDTLLPALPGPSTIVLDQAPYHSVLADDSRAPTTQSTVPTIRTWLRTRGVEFTDDLLKAELVEMVRRNKPRPRYIVDEVAAAAGHRVLRLPPRHCELNPIELIWAQIKGYVARNNTSFKLKDTLKLFHEGKATITSHVWNKAEEHVIREVETVFWNVDGVRDENIDPVIISIDETKEADDGIYDDAAHDDTDGTDERALHSDGPHIRTDSIQIDATGDAGCNMESVSVPCPCLMCESELDPPDDVVRKVIARIKKERGCKCKKGRSIGSCICDSDIEFEWVECDGCEKWAHVDCIPRCGDTAGTFFCPPCKTILRTSYK